MNKPNTMEILKGLEIIQVWLDSYGAKITNINVEGYTVTIYDRYSKPVLQTKDISEVAKHFAKMTEDVILEKIHDDKIPKPTLHDVMDSFREELKTLRKLIK